jgi:hypothetical protein
MEATTPKLQKLLSASHLRYLAVAMPLTVKRGKKQLSARADQCFTARVDMKLLIPM